MRLTSLLLGLLMTPSFFCHGISRVGTGSINQIDFRTPHAMPALKILASGGLSFSGISAPLGGLQFMEVRQLKKEFPNILREEDLITRLKQSGYSQQQPTLQCGFRLRKDNGSTVVEVMGWGPSDGIVIIGKSHAFSKLAMKQLIGSLKLKEGVCK